MAHNISSRIEDRVILIDTAADVVRFSFIVRDSISSLNLMLSEGSGVSDYFESTCCCCVFDRLTKRFINTEEKCRKFLSFERRLLYTLHLDLPKMREYSLKDDRELIEYSRNSRSPHIAKIRPIFGFFSKLLSDFIDDAIELNVPKINILKMILKMPFSPPVAPLLYRLNIETVDKFIDYFYPQVPDSPVFKDFITQLDIMEWMESFERPKILEYLLYCTRYFGIKRLDEDLQLVLVTHCLLTQKYLNVGAILKYVSSCKTTEDDSLDYLNALSETRPGITEDVLQFAEKILGTEKVSRMLQIICIYIDSQRREYAEGATEALRLIWCTIPDPYIKFDEFDVAFGAALGQDDLLNILDFYATTVGDYPENHQPRPLTHLCRTVLRCTLWVNKFWLPDGIRRTGLPTPLQSFLRLEKTFLNPERPSLR